MLGTGTRTARKPVDDWLIGTPVATTAFMTTPGHEAWHPDPEFYYRPGGGPLLDTGPYCLSVLVHLLGPVAEVTGAAATPRAERVIGSGPRAGQRFPVEVATHVTGVLEHAGGALSTLVTSFDAHAARLPRIEVHGTAGSLSVPDPNGFDGPVELYAAGRWQPLPVSVGHPGAGRGTGLADLADALATGRPHLASAELAEHVQDAARPAGASPSRRTSSRSARPPGAPPAPTGRRRRSVPGRAAGRRSGLRCARHGSGRRP
ncbi:Gfo/Idh/MocA family protein [Actinacidiphila sp. ITFR-21]|uniref:Gfo/Idh/MocA family protein n=1 Tax=Actinacidiphila sp. ITFR-21 TaxID=3075199 RepID=UPI0037DA56A0